jgi:hypothetical protein
MFKLKSVQNLNCSEFSIFQNFKKEKKNKKEQRKKQKKCRKPKGIPTPKHHRKQKENENR